MRRARVPRLSTGLRLWAAVGLCIVPMGLLWSFSPGFLGAGTTIYGYCSDSFCSPDIYVPGYYLPGQTTIGYQSPIRVFLLFAAAALVFAATRVRTPHTRRVARAGTVSLAIAALLSAAHGASLTLVCLLAALILTVPQVWAGTARSARFPSRFGGRPVA